MKSKSHLIACQILLISLFFCAVLPDEVLIDYVEETTAVAEQHVRFVMQEVGNVFNYKSDIILIK